MTTQSGDEIINDFYQRGRGMSKGPSRQGASTRTGSPGRPKPPGASSPHSNNPAPPASAAGKKRIQTRDQRLVLALARLLAARTR